MSTKNLRKMLDHYRRITGGQLEPREVQLIDAIQELEAIERAAKDGVALSARIDPYTPHGVNRSEFGRLFESIAKDAP